MIRRLLTVLLFTVYAISSIAEQSANVTVDRAWGLLIGDQVQTQVELPIALASIDLTSLPDVAKRYGTWLYLNNIQVDGDTLLFNYQIINVPTDNTMVDTPEFTIRQLDGGFISIPAVPLTIGSLLTSNNQNIIAKPDHSPILLMTEILQQKLIVYLALAALFSVILLLWHFAWKPRHRLPFAQAVHDLTRLKWRRSNDLNKPARILHGAFNKTVGTIMVYGELANIFEQEPWLKPLTEQINNFYQGSEDHFFSSTNTQQADFNSVMILAKACRAREKRA